MNNNETIAKELGVRLAQVDAAVKLIDEGNAIPFIARYRKDVTDNLNDEQLRNLNERLTYLRNAFASLMVTGPFSILVGYTGGLMALNDRLKLRSMVVGEKDDTVYIASEECAIRVIQPELDKLWAPKGGEPVIVNLKNGGNQ